jgi:hypothetical protein
MAIGTSAGALVYIGPVTSADDITGLSALSYTLVGKVESLGEIGPQAQDVTFIPLAGDAVQHLKGATDNGSTVVMCARDPLDTGQLALKAASETRYEYALKIVLADAADANDTDSTIYVRGPVMSARLSGLDANSVTKVAYGVGNNVFIEDPSDAVP